MSIQSRFITLVARTLNKEEWEVNRHSDLVEELNADSFQLAMIVTLIKSEFPELHINNGDIPISNLPTISDWVEFLESKRNP
jgi:acyl carrier protein